MTHQCMARNKGNTSRCERRATKMLATSSGPSHYSRRFATRDIVPSSMSTVYLCGFCTRSLYSGSRSLYLELDDGSLHTAYVISGDRILTYQEVGS